MKVAFNLSWRKYGGCKMSFDEYAKTWDTEQRINRAKIIANEIWNSIATNKNSTAMEFGCGTGLVSFNLHDKFETITLIDSSKGMIDILNDKIRKYEINNMTANQIDLLDTDSLDMKFDVIYNSMVLHHIKDTLGIVNKFYQLLNKDGYLCIVDIDEEDGSFHKDFPGFDGHNGFNQDELKNMLTSAGFCDVESNTFYHDEKIVEDEKINYSLFIITARKLAD